MDRKSKALRVLSNYKKQNYYYLGEGWEGVVYHDKVYVYKVFIPLNNNGKIEKLWKFGFLKSKIGVFKNRQCISPLKTRTRL